MTPNNKITEGNNSARGLQYQQAQLSSINQHTELQQFTAPTGQSLWILTHTLLVYPRSQEQLTWLQLPRLGRAFSKAETPITFAII